MPARRLLLLIATAATLTHTGCTVVGPRGWAQRRTLPVTEIRAKPWVMYGIAPHRWISPVGEVAIQYERRLTVAGPLTPGASFTVRFPDSREAGLSCRIYVDQRGVFAPHRETHGALFSCVSAEREVVFYTGKGCRYPAALVRPSCHQGQLRIGAQRFVVGRGILKQLDSPVGYVSYTARRGELLGAANIVREQAIDLWMRPARSVAERRRQRSLLLLTVALHQLQHFIAT